MGPAALCQSDCTKGYLLHGAEHNIMLQTYDVAAAVTVCSSTAPHQSVALSPAPNPKSHRVKLPHIVEERPAFAVLSRVKRQDVAAKHQHTAP